MADIRRHLGNLPGISVPSDMIETMSGLDVALERVQKDQLNPYAFYLLALSIHKLERNRNIYRVIRGAVAPIHVIAFMALGAALKAADIEARDPYEAALLSTIACATAGLRTSNDNARLTLLIGVAALRYSERVKGDPVWERRADSAFVKTIAIADNALVAADAALGLMQRYKDRDPEVARALATRARALGSRSTLLGHPPHSGPSIWDLNADSRTVGQRVEDLVTHIVKRQGSRLNHWSKVLESQLTSRGK